MNGEQTIERPNSFPMFRAMVGIGALCGLLIVLTYEGTLPRVLRLKEEALQKAIFRVLPGISQTRAFTFKNGGFAPAEEGDADLIYAGYDDQGQFKGVALEASGQGYADVIRILYGYDLEKQAVVGFYVLESKETPGLGDKIEKDPNFLENFKALDVSLSDDLKSVKNIVVPVKSGTKANPWEVDGITGATISSRAIGNIIGKSSAEWVPLIYGQRSDFEKREIE